MFENTKQHSSSRTDYMFMSLNGLDRKDANFVSTLSSLSICSGGTKFGVTAEYPATQTKFCVAGYAVRRN